MRLIRALARRFTRQERGSIAVEFAILVPVLILLMGATYELAGGIEANSQLNIMVGQVALSWGDCSDSPAGDCQAEMNQYIAARTNIAPALNTSQLTLNLWQVNNSYGTVNVVYGTTAITAAATNLALAQIPEGQSGVIAIGSYNYQARAFTVVTQPFIGSGIVFSQHAVARKG
ncbi:TadE/TadG family type IV pilus assembly protein [Candidatus Raskinella chloraquaticus]|jgi:Flp pilus assembly protein TadG|uniref:TadE-like domain-containing protein n=1 Tax=Candidatus Raskinella chloraquaticus TaxID=1951219 RepID=A0A1W9HXP8_9HYPH|nr:MAG: hypothetical protein A4S15_08800 [Proteobacteria bacterium SG_bin8]